MTKRSNTEVPLQRVGGGESPVEGVCVNNTFELQTERKFSK